MTLGELWNGFRILLGLGLVGLALVLGYASTALLDLGNFRTEGSPAGAAMFVVMLGFPPAALAALVAGILLIRGGRSAQVEGLPVFVDPPPPARREALWRRHPNGATLGMLVNGERAVLQFRPADGAALWCSDNPGYLGAPAATYPFLCSDAELVQLPTAWSVPAALAQRALQQFEANGERPMAIAWQSCAPSAGGSDGGAASWELLPQPTAAR